MQSFNISRLQLSSIQMNILHVQHLHMAYLTLQSKQIPGKLSTIAFLSLILEVSENPLHDPVMNILESKSSNLVYRPIFWMFLNFLSDRWK